MVLKVREQTDLAKMFLGRTSRLYANSPSFIFAMEILIPNLLITNPKAILRVPRTREGGIR